MTKEQLRKKADDKYNKTYQKLIKLFADKEITIEDYSEREHLAYIQQLKEYEEINNDK